MKTKFFSGIVKVLGPVMRVLFRVHHHDPENEPDEGDGPYILVCNHISNADPIFLCCRGMKQQPHYMAKKELFKVPLLNLLVKGLGAYPVNRSGADVSAIKKSIKMLEEGICLGIFPQGHREKGKTPHEATLRNGAAMIGVRAKATFLPCCIRTKKNRFAFFRRVDVYFGKPIPFAELNYDPEAAGEYARVTELVFDRVRALYDVAVAEECAREGK